MHIKILSCAINVTFKESQLTVIYNILRWTIIFFSDKYSIVLTLSVMHNIVFHALHTNYISPDTVSNWLFLQKSVFFRFRIVIF